MATIASSSFLRLIKPKIKSIYTKGIGYSMAKPIENPQPKIENVLPEQSNTESSEVVKPIKAPIRPPSQIQPPSKKPKKSSVEVPKVGESPFDRAIQETIPEKPEVAEPEEPIQEDVEDIVSEPKTEEIEVPDVPLNESGDVDFEELSNWAFSKDELKRIENVYENSNSVEEAIAAIQEVIDELSNQEEPQPEEVIDERRIEPGRGELDAGTGSSGIDRPDENENRESEEYNPVFTARPELTSSADTSLVPESFRKVLTTEQVEGTAKGIKSLEEHNKFFLFDGAGVGKTHQELAIGQVFLNKGMKVLLISMGGVLKASWKKGEMSGSFQKASEDLGVSLNLTENELKEGVINVSSYDKLEYLESQIDENTLVIYDEAHAIRNVHKKDTARAQIGYDMTEKAGKVLFASATPIDEPFHIAYLIKNSETLNGMTVVEAFKSWGLVKKGDKWVSPNPGVDEIVANALVALSDEYTKKGMQLQRGLSLKNVDVQINRLELDPEQQQRLLDIELKKMDNGVAQITEQIQQNNMSLKETEKQWREKEKEYKEVEFKKRNLNEMLLAREIDPKTAAAKKEVLVQKAKELMVLNTSLNERIKQLKDEGIKLVDERTKANRNKGSKADVMMAQRRILEEIKIPRALTLADKELDEGRQLVMFASRVNNTTVTARGAVIDRAEGTMKKLREGLEKRLLPHEIGEIHCDMTKPQQRAIIKKFQEGKIKALIGTIESGGTGIDLDDQRGGHPRSMILITPPWSGSSLIQAIGRLWRLKTKSDPRVYYMFSDAKIDDSNIGILVKKLQVAGAAISAEFLKYIEFSKPEFGMTKFLFSKSYKIKDLRLGRVTPSPFKGLTKGNLFSKYKQFIQSQSLRDATGRKIGELQVSANGVQTMRDASGRKLGEYNSSSNTTYDASGRKIGEGNLLAMLLGSKSIKNYDSKSLGEHKYGCLLSVLPHDIRKQLTDWTIENIPDYHLIGEGRETKPHVTVVYGFEDSDSKTLETLRMLLASRSSLNIKLGELGLFTGGKDGDVLYVSVQSPELENLHDSIINSIDNIKSNHSKYTPHITLAYVDPEYSHLYASEGQKSLDWNKKSVETKPKQTPTKPQIPVEKPKIVEQSVQKPKTNRENPLNNVSEESTEAPRAGNKVSNKPPVNKTVKPPKTKVKKPEVKPDDIKVNLDEDLSNEDSDLDFDLTDPIDFNPAEFENDDDYGELDLEDIPTPKIPIKESRKGVDSIDWNKIAYEELNESIEQELRDIYYKIAYNGRELDEGRQEEALEVVQKEYEKLLQQRDKEIKLLTAKDGFPDWDFIERRLGNKYANKMKQEIKDSHYRAEIEDLMPVIWKKYNEYLPIAKQEKEEKIQLKRKYENGELIELPIENGKIDFHNMIYWIKGWGLDDEIADKIQRKTYDEYSKNSFGSDENGNKAAQKEFDRWINVQKEQLPVSSKGIPDWQMIENLMGSFNMRTLMGSWIDKYKGNRINKRIKAIEQLTNDYREMIVVNQREEERSKQLKNPIEFDFNKDPIELKYDFGSPFDKPMKLKPPKTYKDLKTMTDYLLIAMKYGGSMSKKAMEYFGFDKIDPSVLNNVSMEDMLLDAFEKHNNIPPINEKIVNNKELQGKLEKVMESKKHIENLIQKQNELANLIVDNPLPDKKGVDFNEKLKLLETYSKELSNTSKKLKEHKNNFLHRILKVENPCEINLEIPKDQLSPTVVNSFTKGIEWLTGVVAESPNGQGLKRYKVVPTNDNRASFSHKEDSVNASLIIGTSTVIHELGHAIEYDLPGVRSACRKFLRYRIKDQKARWFTDVMPEGNYDSWEEGMDDDFGKAFGKYGWYVGKKYKDGATEILSMILEAIYNDPYDLAEKDPECFMFGIGILDGRLRDYDTDKIIESKDKYSRQPELRLKPSINDVRAKYSRGV